MTVRGGHNYLARACLFLVFILFFLLKTLRETCCKANEHGRKGDRGWGTFKVFFGNGSNLRLHRRDTKKLGQGGKGDGEESPIFGAPEDFDVARSETG